MTNHYRKFVANYGSTTFLLTQQLKKDNFGWTEDAWRAFEQSKDAIMNVPVLGLPNFSQPFVLETDASGVGVGTVLMQNQHPITFFSQALPPMHRLKAIYEHELMAVVFGVHKWRPYLLGKMFTVRTDQKSFKFLLDQRVVAGEYQRRIAKLLGCDFVIEYKSGLDNTAADALSRMPMTLELVP